MQDPAHRAWLEEESESDEPFEAEERGSGDEGSSSSEESESEGGFVNGDAH